MKIKILLILLVAFTLLYARKNENTTTKLYRAIGESDLAKVKKLKEKGIDLSLPHYERGSIYPDSTPYSPFHKYIPINPLQFLHPTLQKTPNVFEKLPLEIAVILGEFEILKYFIEECNLHIKNRNHQQSLTDIAIQFGHLEVLKYLLANNMYIHFPTALSFAEKCKQVEIALYLKENFDTEVANRNNYYIEKVSRDSLKLPFNSKFEHIVSYFKGIYTKPDLNLLEEPYYKFTLKLFQNTLLHGYTYEQQKKMVSENEISLSTKDINGISLYFISFKQIFRRDNNSRFVLEYAKEDFSAIDYNGANIFMYASQVLPFEEFKELMKNYNFGINYKDFENRTILDYAQYAHCRSWSDNNENFWKIIIYLNDLGAKRGTGFKSIPLKW